jgi:hypothetical protein
VDFLNGSGEPPQVTKMWINLVFGEFAFALKREAVDGEALSIIIDGLNGVLNQGLFECDGEIVREMVLEKVRGFSEIILGWKVESDAFQRAIGGLCEICQDDVNLAPLLEFVNGIRDGEIPKVRFLVFLWEKLGERVVKEAAEAFDSLSELDVDAEVPRFWSFFDAILLQMAP